MGEYTMSYGGLVNCPLGQVIRWLATPDLMAKWIMRAERIEALDDLGIAAGAQTRLEVRGRIGSTAYRGEIIEINQARFVRRYYATGQGIDAADFVRTVCFDFAAAGPGTGWNCSVHTNVRGVRDSVLKVGVREQRTSMRRSLDRLRVLAGGGQAGLLTRVNDGNSYGQAL